MSVMKDMKSMKRVGHLQQITLSFAGYERSNLKSALSKIMEQSAAFNVIVYGSPVKQHIEQVEGHPILFGCSNNDDIIIETLSVSGSLDNIKKLVRQDTPAGVQIELLSPAA